ncbi:hypothetical protein ACIBM1_00365 [Streptomyces sp. NPDC050481]
MHGGSQSSATLDALGLLWRKARRAQAGRQATQSRLAQESAVSVSTINDWLTGKTVPRHGDQVLSVVRVLHRWCGDPPAVERDWLALLERDSDSRSTSGTAVVPPPRIAHAAPSVLGANISRAFEAEHVELQAFCLTTETMEPHIRSSAELVRSGAVRPRSVSLHLLLPADTASLAYPVAPGNPEDNRPLRRLAAMRHRYTASIRAELEALRHEHGVDVDLEFRAVPLTPTTKIYLLNRDTVLFGYYEVVQRPLEFDDASRTEVHDVLGLQLRMFTRSESGDALFVDMTQTWFDSLWAGLAVPLTEV